MRTSGVASVGLWVTRRMLGGEDGAFASGRRSEVLEGVDDLAGDDVGFDVEAVSRLEAGEGGVLERGGDEGDLEPGGLCGLIGGFG